MTKALSRRAALAGIAASTPVAATLPALGAVATTEDPFLVALAKSQKLYEKEWDENGETASRQTTPFSRP